jgi:hypothetical protein
VKSRAANAIHEARNPRSSGGFELCSMLSVPAISVKLTVPCQDIRTSPNTFLADAETLAVAVRIYLIRQPVTSFFSAAAKHTRFMSVNTEQSHTGIKCAYG